MYANYRPRGNLGAEKASAKNRGNREAGKAFEQLLERSFDALETMGYLSVEKTPEPIKILSARDKYGHFTACFVKKSQSDFGGTLAGGRSFRAEAKCTTSDRIAESVVRPDQVDYLRHHDRLGAVSMVIVGFIPAFGAPNVYAVPFCEWDSIFSRLGHKYALESDLGAFAVKSEGGVLRLDDAVRRAYPDAGE
jgi:recombination protein U